ncbi:hypothetical protein BREVNS_0558 [Brevinematales bacterium NS]|nr:hypothetical protein BREVNS_0558 [Brevinematales bacterium NS]
MKVYFLIWFVLSGIFMRMYGGKIDTKQIVYLFNNTDYTIWATSELKEKGRHYSVKNLLDGDITTVWATRENGGVGEEVIVFFSGSYMVDEWKRGVWIVNGYNKSENLFLKNNRVKEMEIKLYRYYLVGVTGATLEAGPPREALLVNPLRIDNIMAEPLVELILCTNIMLIDSYLYTNNYYFPIHFGSNEKETALRIRSLRIEKGIQDTQGIFKDYYGYDAIGYALVLTIKSIYKGTQYNDLCISEIGFLADDK